MANYTGPDYHREWETRAAHAARMIRPCSTVVDFGCGKKILKEYLINCKYYGYDQDDFDFEGEWPASIEPHEYAVILGVLEWLDHPLRLLTKMTADTLVVSYVPYTPGQLQTRLKNGWRSHLTAEHLTSFLTKAGYRAVSVQSWNDQLIMKCERV